jgi:hypothetical protein
MGIYRRRSVYAALHDSVESMRTIVQLDSDFNAHPSTIGRRFRCTPFACDQIATLMHSFLGTEPLPGHQTGMRDGVLGRVLYIRRYYYRPNLALVEYVSVGRPQDVRDSV